MLQRATAAVRDAPFGDPDGDWGRAMALTAQACGGWGMQVLAFSPRTEILWDWSSGISRDLVAEFERLTADAPELNPRVRVLLAPPMQVVGDDDLMPEASRRRTTIYAELYEPVDAPYAGVVQFAPVPDEARIVLGVVRSHRAGAIDPVAARALGALAEAWRAALRLKIRLDDGAAAIAAGALDVVGGPAFLVDRAGRVVAASAAGDAELVSGAHLRTRLGVLSASRPRDEAELRAAFAAVLADPDARATRSILLEGADGPRVAEIAALPPHAHATHRSAVALVVLTPLVRSRAAAASLLQRLYGLSPAEAEVALSVAEGLAVGDIAVRRGVSIGTLRNQLKAIFDKCGVGAQAQLASRILRLLGGAWL